MIKRVLVFFSIVFLVVACGFGGPDKPKNLISKDKMVNILIDARLMGSATHINKQKMVEHGVKLDQYVFEKYGIDSLQFALSNAYYTYHINDYEEIYNTVTDSLEALKKQLKEQKLKEEKELTKKEKDSTDVLVTKDSLDIIRKKDSLSENVLKRKFNKGHEEGILINPASNKNVQSLK